MAAKYPESDADTLYIMGEEINLSDLIDIIYSHFGAACDLRDFDISQRNIQIDHFTYDLYDPVDWCQYFIITRK